MYNENIHDGVLFVDEIELFSYKDKSPIIESHELGLKYHILSFKDNQDSIDDITYFEAILGDPFNYVNNLINLNYKGLIAKKTTNSNKLIDEMAQNLLSP